MERLQYLLQLSSLQRWMRVQLGAMVGWWGIAKFRVSFHTSCTNYRPCLLTFSCLHHRIKKRKIKSQECYLAEGIKDFKRWSFFCLCHQLAVWPWVDEFLSVHSVFPPDRWRWKWISPGSGCCVRLSKLRPVKPAFEFCTETAHVRITHSPTLFCKLKCKSVTLKQPLNWEINIKVNASISQKLTSLWFTMHIATGEWGDSWQKGRLLNVVKYCNKTSKLGLYRFKWNLLIFSLWSGELHSLTYLSNSGSTAGKSIVLPWMKTTVVPWWDFAVRKLWKRKLWRGQSGEMITDWRKNKKKVEIRDRGLLPEIISAILHSRNNIFNITEIISCLTAQYFVAVFFGYYRCKVSGCYESAGWGVLAQQLTCGPKQQLPACAV